MDIGTGHHGWRHAILLPRRLPASTASAWRQLGVPSCTSAFGCPWYQASITRGPRLSFRARQLFSRRERRNEARRLTSSLPPDIPSCAPGTHAHARALAHENSQIRIAYVCDIIIDKSPDCPLAVNCANYYSSSRIYVGHLRSCADPRVGGRFGNETVL